MSRISRPFYNIFIVFEICFFICNHKMYDATRCVICLFCNNKMFFILVKCLKLERSSIIFEIEV